jgi:hypothetical protein
MEVLKWIATLGTETRLCGWHDDKPRKTFLGELRADEA